MGSRTVKRIADVSKLRSYQFPQVFSFCLFVSFTLVISLSLLYWLQVVISALSH